MGELLEIPPLFDPKVTPIGQAYLYRIFREQERVWEDIKRITGLTPEMMKERPST